MVATKEIEDEINRRIDALRAKRAASLKKSDVITIKEETNATSSKVAGKASKILKDLRDGELNETTIEEVKSVAASALKQTRKRKPKE